MSATRFQKTKNSDYWQLIFDFCTTSMQVSTLMKLSIRSRYSLIIRCYQFSGKKISHNLYFRKEQKWKFYQRLACLSLFICLLRFSFMCIQLKGTITKEERIMNTFIRVATALMNQSILQIYLKTVRLMPVRMNMTLLKIFQKFQKLFHTALKSKYFKIFSCLKSPRLEGRMFISLSLTRTSKILHSMALVVQKLDWTQKVQSRQKLMGSCVQALRLTLGNKQLSKMLLTFSLYYLSYSIDMQSSQKQRQNSTPTIDALKSQFPKIQNFSYFGLHLVNGCFFMKQAMRSAVCSPKFQSHQVQLH